MLDSIIFIYSIVCCITL